MDRYEEALERAKAAIKDCGDNLGRKKMIYGIFPELQESEDERNWKAVMEYVKDDALRAWLEKQKEQKPKMTPKWLYRLEFKDSSCGLWYDGSGKWCFESGIGSIDGCKTKTLSMDYDARYKQDGRDWFSSCSRKEDLMHWYSLEDAKELISKGFVFTRYLATEYHEYDQQTVFIKETALCREQIDIFELFGQKSAEWSAADEEMLDAMKDIVSNALYEPLCPKEGMLAWLEARRPQPHWKPSGEQLLALKRAIEEMEKIDSNTASTLALLKFGLQNS